MSESYTAKDHTFVICAYRESPYLMECIESVLLQSEKGNVIISTSTPNTFIKDISQKYHLRIVVNRGKGSAQDNFNFAIAQAETPLVTLCHQDDFFDPNYLKKILDAVNVYENVLIAFSHYAEYRDGDKVYRNRLLQIKKVMLTPIRCFPNSRFVRRRILSIGCPICCPAVTYHKQRLSLPIFTDTFTGNIDWEAWEKISKQEGSFVYVNEPLLFKRIHAESETSRQIEADNRSKEDYEMLCKFWPKWIAKTILHFYEKSQKSNTL